MKSERILNTLGQVEEKYIEEAASAWKDAEETSAARKGMRETAPSRRARRPGWLKWGALAACLIMTMYVGVEFAGRKVPGDSLGGFSDSGAGETTPDSPAIAEGGVSPGFSDETQGGNPELPMLKIAENTNAEGFEGYMAYDISDLVNANPWSEDMELSVLPVYRNVLSYDESYIVSGADFEAMGNFLSEIASWFGMDVENLTIRDNTPASEEQAAILEKTGGDIPEGYFNPTAVIAQENGIKIEVDIAMTATITFDRRVLCPTAIPSRTMPPMRISGRLPGICRMLMKT